jgi:hypothetical protein
MWHWMQTARPPQTVSLLHEIYWLIDHADGVRLTPKNRGHQRVYCSFPRWYESLESHNNDDDASWEKTPDSSTRALWQTYHQRHLGTRRRNGRRSLNFAYQYPRYVNRSFKCRKILRHGTSGFTSHPKEGVLRIFIALKNPSPRYSLNPRLLGPVAITLTTTPPRWLHKIYDIVVHATESFVIS